MPLRRCLSDEAAVDDEVVEVAAGVVVSDDDVVIDGNDICIAFTCWGNMVVDAALVARMMDLHDVIKSRLETEEDDTVLMP